MYCTALCREACYSDDSCKAYSVVALRTGMFNCSISTTFTHGETQLEPNLELLPNWTTLKSKSSVILLIVEIVFRQNRSDYISG